MTSSELEDKILALIRSHSCGLSPAAIQKLAGIDRHTWWQVRDRLEKARLIKCADIPAYGGVFNWYAR